MQQKVKNAFFILHRDHTQPCHNTTRPEISSAIPGKQSERKFSLSEQIEISPHRGRTRQKKGEWTERPQNLDCSTWEPANGVDGQAIVLDYLDTETIEYLGRELELDPRLFQAHLAGCEQHHTGDWAPSEFTVAPYLQSLRRKSHFVTVDYRRPYSAPNDSSLAIFNDTRIQTCSVLRSHHLLEAPTLCSNMRDTQ